MRGDDPLDGLSNRYPSEEFPACAGMIRAAPAPADRLRRVPRMRGDDPDTYATGKTVEQSSPHARG